jgi:hypothetical protein
LFTSTFKETEMTQVLALTSATNALFAKNKASVSEAVAALDAKTVVVALRDNGDKVNGTLVLIAFEGATDLKVGDVVNARNGQNKRPNGAHTVLAVATATGVETDDTVDVATVRAAVFVAE